MTAVEQWLTVIGMGIVTYGMRLVPIVLLERFHLPLTLRRALRYVPPAVLSAIIFPELLIRDGELRASIGNPRLLAGLLAAIVAWRTRNVFVTIAVGLAALWVLQALAG